MKKGIKGVVAAQDISANISEIQIGTKLISKSGTKLIYKGVSKEHSWLVICEIAESTNSRNPLLKGECNYFEPCDLYLR